MYLPEYASPTPIDSSIYDLEQGTLQLANNLVIAPIFFFFFQGDKFYIELYGGNVVVTKRLDYESINNYTLKIVAKVESKNDLLLTRIILNLFPARITSEKA